MDKIFHKGQLIAYNDSLYIYEGYNEKADSHTIAIVDCDDKGNLIATGIEFDVSSKELSEGENKISLTEKQYHGIVFTLAVDYGCSEEDAEIAADDIVCRSFAIVFPKFNDLESYVRRYLNR